MKKLFSFSFFRKKRKHRFPPIPITGPGKHSSNTTTSLSAYKPTEEHLLRLFSTSSDQSMTSSDSESSSSSYKTAEKEIQQNATSSKHFTSAVGLSGEATTEETDSSTSSSDDNETTEDTDAMDVLQKIIKLEKHLELIETYLLNQLLFSKFRR
ncbi:hypothetical protein GOODEAATRI_031354 [Goodea atripinnis]|uniref:Uncharacterized protein n=1 Tax=Goodea atripinnis TaxID=208336 RepID=A0ABV0N5S1_9TELE